MRHVVIIGGGFAGLWSAMGAARQIQEAGAQDTGIKQPADVGWSAARVNYRPGCVLTRGGRAIATVSLEWDQHGRIAQVFTVRNPDKLRFVASYVS